MTQEFYSNDNRIVLTLDAGGTNFVFSAMQQGESIVAPISRPSNGHNLELCLGTIVKGFEQVKKHLKDSPVAISFAFPGPADYPTGIIGDLNNLPAFRGGVPLKAILENHFKIPVFINNDGDLYAYGEAMAGFLSEVNRQLKASGSYRQYKNLIGITLGTGFGSGIVRNSQLYIGDNSTAAEVWKFSNRYLGNQNVEEGVSIRAVISNYRKRVADAPQGMTPKDIFDIAAGKVAGDTQAARDAFAEMGQVLGDTIANLMTYMDASVVIGGGITGAREFYMPAVMEQLKKPYVLSDGKEYPRIVQKVFDFDESEERKMFLEGNTRMLPVPGTSIQIPYDPESKLTIGHSTLGASKAIAIGAYVFALQNL